METSSKPEFNPRTMKNKDGNYPKWLSKAKVQKLKVANKSKVKNKKKNKTKN